MTKEQGSYVDKSVESIRWHRNESARVPFCPDARVYECAVKDGFLRAIVSRDETEDGVLWHLSVSFKGKIGADLRLPTWDELRHAKSRLIHDDIAMHIVFPKKSTKNYIDIHKTTLHLYECDERFSY